MRAKNSSKDDVGEFYRSMPEIDECRYLIKKVLEQAVRDFVAFKDKTSATEKYDYETAVCFLFDDTYRVDWGGREMSLQDLLDWVDIEVEWVRKKALETRKRKQKRFSIKKAVEDEEEDMLHSGTNGVRRKRRSKLEIGAKK
jgi:hypothetical protein